MGERRRPVEAVEGSRERHRGKTAGWSQCLAEAVEAASGGRPDSPRSGSSGAVRRRPGQPAAAPAPRGAGADRATSTTTGGCPPRTASLEVAAPPAAASADRSSCRVRLRSGRTEPGGGWRGPCPARSPWPRRSRPRRGPRSSRGRPRPLPRAAPRGNRARRTSSSCPSVGAVTRPAVVDASAGRDRLPQSYKISVSLGGESARSPRSSASPRGDRAHSTMTRRCARSVSHRRLRSARAAPPGPGAGWRARCRVRRPWSRRSPPRRGPRSSKGRRAGHRSGSVMLRSWSSPPTTSNDPAGYAVPPFHWWVETDTR